MLKSRWYGYKDLVCLFFKRMYRVLTFIFPFPFSYLRTFIIFPKNNIFSFKSNPITLMTELALFTNAVKHERLSVFAETQISTNISDAFWQWENNWFNTYNFKIKDAQMEMSSLHVLRNMKIFNISIFPLLFS